MCSLASGSFPMCFQDFRVALCSKEEGGGLHNSPSHIIDAKKTLILKVPHIQTVDPLNSDLLRWLSTSVLAWRVWCVSLCSDLCRMAVWCLGRDTSLSPQHKAITFLTFVKPSSRRALIVCKSRQCNGLVHLATPNLFCDFEANLRYHGYWSLSISTWSPQM